MQQRCLEYRKLHETPHAHSILSPAYTVREVAAAGCKPAHSLAKVIVYSGDNGYGLPEVPADSIVGFGEGLRLLGLREIPLSAESELVGLFPDCELGAMPPFGNLFEMLVLMHKDIAAAKFMAFNAGTHQVAAFEVNVPAVVFS